MNKVIQKSTWTVFGLTLALLSGAPALADDTELLLVAPPDPSESKPSVMFILDSSGSMDTVEIAALPYDSTETYVTGTCDANNLYYSSGSVPICDGSNTLYVDKQSFYCDASTMQIDGVGNYTGTLVQYRSGASGAKEWQELEAGNSSDDVECEMDSGLHGDGRAGYVYAASGSGMSDPWTTDPLMEIAWGSSGRNVTYSVYDGNYLNYLDDPTSVNKSRSDIMKEVTKTVLSSVSDMNVGFMRFNNQGGGPVLMTPIDLDTNRAAILAMIDTLQPDGWTPLSETLFESALFWQGLPAHYGEIINEHATDPAALASTAPEVYRRPDLLACAKNFNVLISDGLPSDDTDTPGLLGQLPNYAATVGRAGCTGTGDGGCLVDMGEYLSKVDIDPVLGGRQSVITHTIGYTQDLPILRDTAQASGGQYILADDVDGLAIALTEIVASVSERALSFTAPAVSVNTFNRTRNLNNVYLTMFGVRGNAHWPGNLKAYRIEDGNIVDAVGDEAVDPVTGFFYSTARSYWTAGQADGNDVLLGGAANQLPNPGARRLFTDNGMNNALSAASNEISSATAGSYTTADFGFGATTTTVDEVIDWMLGEDVKDVDNDPLTTVRNAMGDPLHARPAAIVYGGTAASPEAVVFTATNDGYLHAVDADTGRELWSYVPKELLPRIAGLFEDPEMKYKLYGLDGDIVPVVRDVDKDGIIESADGDFVYILFGMRRGGSTYRMLDVTDKNDPVLMWERVLDEGGQSWSTPVVSRMAIAGAAQNTLKAVVLIGGGYDGVNDTATFNATPDGTGAGVHVLDLLSGNTLWRAGHTSTTADLKIGGMTRSIPTKISVVDINGDSFADRMYASDMGGQIWRFDITNGNPAASLVAGGVIAQLGAEGLAAPSAADTRRLYNSPDIAMFNDVRQNRRYISVSIGSGYRAHPLDLGATDRFYSLRDRDVFSSLSQTQYNNYTIITEADLIDVSGQLGVTVTADDAGWMLTLPGNEMVLADSVTFNDEIFFVSFSPDSSGALACNVGQGTNYLYRVNVINGDPIFEDFSTIIAGDEDTARKQRLAQGGIAPSPQFLFPNPDANCVGEDCKPPPLGCVGVECFDPGFENNPVRTLWTQDGIE
jgi:type IV pilus assembly protein PilY1